MKPVYLAGRGLACARGLDIQGSLAALQAGNAVTATRSLPGESGGHFPYFAIPHPQDDWTARARALVQRVAAEAGAREARSGTLLIATSSLDVGAAEQGGRGLDYGAFAGDIAAWLDWSGPVHVINTACISGLNALLAAHALLSTGEQDDALVLGVELDNRLTLAGFAALQLLSPDRSRPFGAHRNGLVLGEAVAALRLSTREPSRWQVKGGANVVDGSQPTGASPSAVAAMYRRALAASGLAEKDIDLIKVQAAGSPGNDAAEAEGLRNAFGVVPPLVSLKAEIGHCMGASGAAEIALLTACLDSGVWPTGADAADAGLGVSLCPRIPADVRRVMATILGFGGSHATVVLERA